ncbi:MAG: hypothetical protein FJZ80_03450 [Bacteroidetes bacterium]|nr:hypothetical protein [Bacteroidota bacterium]
MWTDIVYAVGDLFTVLFVFFEVIQNYFNDLLLLTGFVGFAYWMYVQHNFSKKANVPSEVGDRGFEGWYKDENKQIK